MNCGEGHGADPIYSNFVDRPFLYLLASLVKSMDVMFPFVLEEYILHTETCGDRHMSHPYISLPGCAASGSISLSICMSGFFFKGRKKQNVKVSQQTHRVCFKRYIGYTLTRYIGYTLKV